MRSVSDL
jgi:hypothetical protein